MHEFVEELDACFLPWTTRDRQDPVDEVEGGDLEADVTFIVENPVAVGIASRLVVRDDGILTFLDDERCVVEVGGLAVARVDDLEFDIADHTVVAEGCMPLPRHFSVAEPAQCAVQQIDSKVLLGEKQVFGDGFHCISQLSKGLAELPQDHLSRVSSSGLYAIYTIALYYVIVH